MKLLKEYCVSSKHTLSHNVHKKNVEGFIDRIYLVLYQDTKTAEFTIAWIMLGDYPAIYLKVFEDSWWALGLIFDVQTFLAQMGNKLTVENLCGFLDSVGYVES